MKARAVSQPGVGRANARDFIVEQLSSPSVVNFAALTGWVQPSGIQMIRDELREFRGRGGTATLVTGLSLGAATIEGLEAALAEFDEVFVAFDPSNRTIHSKMYAGIGVRQVSVLVGSQNLTRGGLVTNHELGVRLDGDADDGVIIELLEHLKDLRNDNAITRLLDTDLLVRLRSGNQVAFTQIGRGTTSTSDAIGERVFSRSERPFRSDGRPAVRASDSRPALPPSDYAELPVGEGTQVTHRWFKRLPRSDVLRPRPPASPTNTVTLTANGLPIDKTTWFREAMFADAHWVDDGGQQLATVPFMVWGLTPEPFASNLVLVHNPSHDSGQSNRVTSIRWADPLKTVLRTEVDATDMYLTIEAFSDQTYRLTFGPQAAGEFIG